MQHFLLAFLLSGSLYLIAFTIHTIYFIYTDHTTPATQRLGITWSFGVISQLRAWHEHHDISMFGLWLHLIMDQT